jgi:hypothetical protein
MLDIRHASVYHQYDRPSYECPEYSFGIEPPWQPTSTSLPVTIQASKSPDEWIIAQPLPKLISNPITSPSATFTDHLTSLPPWEIQLFESLEMHHSCYELIELIAESNTDSDIELHLLAVSDGSAFDRSMSFGWSMSLPSGHRLATCAGPAPGSKQSSFRAEGYGLLSITRFLHHLFLFCDTRPDWKIRLMSDNDPLIKCIATTRPYPQCFPNSTLVADWDVTHMIITTLQQLPCQISIQHVKGHQDDHKHYDELPLDAQLNCDADHEAVFHQTIHATYRPIVPRLHSNTAQFHIAGATINSGYKTAIRNAFSEPALLKHIQTSNKWSDLTTATVNLTSHRQALDCMSSRHIQLVKLCHDILPTAKTTNRYSHIQSPNCPICKNEIEDLSHLLRCHHPDRKPW